MPAHGDAVTSKRHAGKRDQGLNDVYGGGVAPIPNQKPGKTNDHSTDGSRGGEDSTVTSRGGIASGSRAKLRSIYRAETVPAAHAALEAFAASPDGQHYPTIAPIGERQWDAITPGFAYPPEVRRILTTTNAIESLHMQTRKILKTRGHFPNDEAATKLVYLALRNIHKRLHAAPAWQGGAHALCHPVSRSLRPRT